MARDFPLASSRIRYSILANSGLVFITVLLTVNAAGHDVIKSYCSENDLYPTEWFHCPQGWTLFKNRCFKITEALLTWMQAQILCRSYGGYLVRIKGQCDQEWVSHYVKEQLLNISHSVDKDPVHAASSIEAWIGLSQLPNKTFQWSDGQAAVEQEGFWAVEGLKVSDASVTKLCCDIKEHSSKSPDLRWQLRLCDELHSSVCELRACEKHAIHCSDGSKCVSKTWLCDGHWDCQDGSDERDCFQSTETRGPHHCGSVMKGESGTFSSLNYPEEYPPFLNCLWRIETEPPQAIELLIETLEIEDKYDTLNIYEGTELSDNQLIATMGGRAYNYTVRSVGSVLTVQFTSDYSVQGKGFLVSWKSELDTKTCGGNLVAVGEETMFSFPPSDQQTAASSMVKALVCDWIISSYTGTDIITLQFKNITLGSGNSITVYDGRAPDTPPITHITSTAGPATPSAEKVFSEAPYAQSLNIPPVITSSGQQLLLRLIINKGSSLSSFVVAYKNGCDTFISTSLSVIMSPGYTKSQYPNNLNCTWTVPKDVLGRRVTLLFLPHFFTELGRDNVQVSNFNKEQQVLNVIQLSGHNSSLETGISSYHGFIISFESDYTVNRGRWAAITSYDCIQLSVLPPLVLNSTDIEFGSTVGFTCLEGFRLEGPAHAICGWNGQWIPTVLPACKKINCGPIPVPPGAYLVNSTGLTYGSTARYQCLHGYKFVHQTEATCGEHGWQEVPSCQLITCPKEYPPAGGNARAEDTRVGYMREFFCRPKFQLVGSKFSHCNISGQWTEPVPVCKAQKCPALHGFINGRLNLTEPVEVGQSVLASCEDGYQLVGNNVLTCLNDLHFNFPLPACVDIDECNSSQICDIHVCQNFIGGYSCFCHDGYKHQDNTSHTCTDINECEVKNSECSHSCINMPGTFRCTCPQDMKLYEGPIDKIGNVTLIANKTCIATCNPHVVTEDIKIVYRQKPLSNGEFMFGTNTVIICPDGLYINGSSVTSCQTGIGWYPPVANCIELYCEAPRDINNGFTFYTNQTLGSSVRYSCKQSHTLVGPRIRFCEQKLDVDLQTVKLVWSEHEPACVYVTCPELVSDDHGTVDYATTIVDSVAVFRCRCGYRLVGQSVVTCMPDGQWNFPSPICEAQSCLHPGLPPQSTMVEHTPGFPVESIVKFQCVDKGYRISSQDPIKCLAYSQSKVSTLKPSLHVAIRGGFVPASQANLSSACILTYRTETFIRERLKEMIHLCRGLNVVVNIHKNISSQLTSTFLNFTSHLSLSSKNTSSTCTCYSQLLSYLADNLNHLRLISLDSSCQPATLRLHTALTSNAQWLCGPGLRLENEQQKCGQMKLPSCMEDCIDEGIELWASTELPLSDADSEKMSTVVMYSSVVAKLVPGTTTNPKIFPTLTSPRIQFLTELIASKTPKKSVSASSTAASSLTINANTSTEKLKLQNTEVTIVNAKKSAEMTTKQQTYTSESPSTLTLISFKMPLTSDPANKNSEILNSEPTKAMTSPQKITPEESGSTSYSAITTTPSSETTFSNTWPRASATPFTGHSRLTTSISRTKSNLDDQKFSAPQYHFMTASPVTSSHQNKDVRYVTTASPLETASKNVSKGNDITISPWMAATNCASSTDYSPVSHEQQVNSSQFTSSKLSQNDSTISGNVNTTDFMTTHSLEKHTVTLVQGPSVPSVDSSVPVYSVEIYDYIWGSFTNISCIDAVHASINVKVNELLIDFVNKIGKQACQYAPDASLEMTAGNIRFGGTRAKIYVKFSITYTTSSKSSTASCGAEFQSYAADQLPQKLETVETETSIANCKFVNYTRRGFNTFNHGWSCQSGYTLDEDSIQCYHSSTRGSSDTNFTTAITTPSPPVPVASIPRAYMVFAGTFTSSSPEDQVDDHCIQEYKVELAEILSVVEQNLQSRCFNDISTVIDKDINLTVSDKKVIAEVTVNLIPLLESVDFLSLSKCANFTSLQFREPSQKTLSVAAPQIPLINCPMLVLSHHGFRTDISRINLYCTPGYVLSKSNFKCINESLPLFSTRIEIAMTGTYEEHICKHVILVSSEQLVTHVFRQIQNGLTTASICNGSKDILFLQEQGNVSVGNPRVNITIPVILVNLQFNKSETVQCVEQLYIYLRSAISQPISTMIGTLLATCRANFSLPLNYKVSVKQWTCPPRRVYNPFMHRCDILKNISSTQTAEQKASDRGKRSVISPQLRPQWNGSLPTCIDIEAPTFHSCPVEPVVIKMDHLGLVPVTVILPTVTDNSGMVPKLTVRPDIRLPYMFSNNTTVVMEAKDESGNIATCIFNVTIIDQISPSINCPGHLVTVSAKSWQGVPQIDYQNIHVTAVDNSGQVSIFYKPRDGTTITTSSIILVTASAVDGSLNMANCSFFARIEFQGCSENNLPRPKGGNKSCVHAGAGNEFPVQQAKVLQCSLLRYINVVAKEAHGSHIREFQNALLSPAHNLTGHSPEDRFPDFEVRLSFYMPYQGNTTGDCLKEMLDAIIEAVKLRFSTACLNDTQNLNFTNIDSVGAFHKAPLTMMTAKLKISIQLAFHNMTKSTIANWCGRAVLNELEFNNTLSGSCGQIKLSNPASIAGKDSCPKGFALVNGTCHECPVGSFLLRPECKDCPKENYQNISDSVNCGGLGFDCPDGQYRMEPKCLECSVGTFQNLTGSSQCIHCKSGFSTLTVGAQDEVECIAECKPNHFSPAGLEPCLPCPLGTHQPRSGSKDCQVCDFDSSGRSHVDSSGRSHVQYCKKLCAPGEYSSDGTFPCTPCPVNYFNENNDSTTCLECPDNKITKIAGSWSQTQCEEHNPCENKSCQKGSHCQRQGRSFVCECLPGLTGAACKDKTELHNNQFYENTGRCQNFGNTSLCLCPLGFTGVTCSHVSVIDHCLSNPCVYGYCTSTSVGFNCSCYSGYHGNRCHKTIDNCAAVTCHNGGFCVDNIVDFHCTCPENFTGQYCDVEIGHCAVNYCQNGGMCIPGTSTFHCLCTEGFTGEFCEVNINECASSPCVNKGICMDDSNSYRCLCQPEYTGMDCESVVDPCETNVCLNGGDCFKTENTKDGFHCKCKEGYTGKKCEVDIDYCHPMPCNLQGCSSCEDLVLGFKCHCLPGWTGGLCDEQMDPCSRNSCYNGATCSNLDDTFMCICPPMFTGPTCLISLNFCESNPCQNSGSCVERNSSFSCMCQPGFAGSLCEVNIDECASNSCFNRGHCQDGVNAFFCSCPRGFAGELCEVDINECISHPCQHNASCTQLEGDFRCNCVSGFAGRQCEFDIDECSSSPCQHQGKCVDQVASFHCNCPEGYTGTVCEEREDKCQNNMACLNNATCNEVNGKIFCVCSQDFTGPDCGKKKTANFDLHFLGDKSLASHSLILYSGNLNEFSLCLWVKFDKSESYGTYLVLTSEDGSSIFLTLNGMYATSLAFASEKVDLRCNDGQWHHLCLMMSTSHWIIFKDGENLLQGQTSRWLLQNSLKLIIGQPVSSKDSSEWFSGYLHGVNIYSFAMEKTDVHNLSQSCDIRTQGDLFNWVTAESQLFGGIVIMPSQCGQNIFPTDVQVYLGSAVNGEDKVPPDVVMCPSTVIVTSEQSLVPVTWSEPEFTDNVGIISVKQNFRPGQIFSHGQYLVTYIGYDANNNSAECSFHIYIRKSSCMDPPPPANGAHVCGEWDHGRYCIPSCTHNFHFLTPIPPLFRCGNEGIWDSSDGDSLIFPICSRTYSPGHTVHGDVSFEGPQCTSTLKLKLQEKLVHVLNRLGTVMHLCNTDQVCNLLHGLSIECNHQTQRKKRFINSGKSIFTVKLNFTISSNLSDKVENPESMPDKIIHFIKNNQTENDFYLISVDLQVSSHCHSGQMLINSNRPQCLNCPAGYFMNAESVCSPCPKGWYNDKQLQTSCQQCPHGMTTESQGSTNASQCYDICNAGSYFSVSNSRCEPCSKGKYQNTAGQSDCKTCPGGLTTQFIGAKSVDDCQDVCPPGQELGTHGTCIDCPHGTYRTGTGSSSFCIPCPYSWTTDREKATDVSQCSIKKCSKGYYHNADDKGCHPCPLGTFQTSRGATSCEPCGIRLTTNNEGADSRSFCRPGKVNECHLNIDKCGPDAWCVDLDDGYKCECKHGKIGAGKCVDICEKYCSNLSFCNNGARFQDKDCHCSVEMCKDEASRDNTYESLVITSITVTVIATLILLLIIVICIYRRNTHIGQDKHVRMYRDETELASFTNQAFDSFSAQVDLNRDETFLQISAKMATRWHNQHFMLQRPNSVEEIELADF